VYTVIRLYVIPNSGFDSRGSLLLVRQDNRQSDNEYTYVVITDLNTSSNSTARNIITSRESMHVNRITRRWQRP